MKRILLLAVSVLLVLVMVAGVSKNEAVEFQKSSKAISVQEVRIEENPTYLKYIGTVGSKDIIKYSFKSTGKISRVLVKEGDKVSKGDMLVKLDMQDLIFQLNGAEAMLNTAKLDIEKAEDALTYNTDLFNKINNLYSAGSASKSDLDKVKLSMDTSTTVLSQAKSQYEAAKTDYEFKLSLSKDATIYANQDGSVIDLPFKEGELIPAGNPAVILRSSTQIINVGITQKDLNNIDINTEVAVDIDGQKSKGYINTIAEAPDMSTRTYNAEILIDDSNYRLGSIANISIITGVKSGIWLPISTIQSDGEDYVFIVSGDRVNKRIVKLTNLYEDKVMVEGVEVGEKIVMSGMKSIFDGSLINIVN